MSIVLHMRRKSQKNPNESEHEDASATNGNAVENETKENSGKN